MTPYFSENGITIYHGDCREILPSISAGSVVVTDQPYGTGWARGGGKQGEFIAKRERPEWDVFDTGWVALARDAKRIAAFTPCARLEEMTAAVDEPAILYYLKTNVRPGAKNIEPIVVSPPPARKPWRIEAYNGDAPFHPCQKPNPVMCWLIGVTADHGDFIVDPFMGSGSTLRAAKDLGFRAVGIELDERYCEIAARRLGQGVLALGATQ